MAPFASPSRSFLIRAARTCWSAPSTAPPVREMAASASWSIRPDASAHAERALSWISQAVGEDLGDLLPELAAQAQVGDEGGAPSQVRGQRRPFFPGPVKGGEGGQGRGGSSVGKPLGDRGLENVGEPILPARRGGQAQELGAERRLGVRIAPLVGVLAYPRVEGLGGLPARLAQRCDLRQDGSPLAGIHVLEPDLEQLRELHLVAGSAVGLLEQARRGGARPRTRQRASQPRERRPFLRELLQDRREGVDRGVRVVGSLEQDRSPEQGLLASSRIAPTRLGELAQDGGQLLDAPLPRQVPVERLQGLDVARRRPAQTLPGVDGAGPAVDPLAGSSREAQEVVRLHAVRRGGGRLPDLGQHVEPLRLGGKARDVGQGFLPLPPAPAEGAARGLERARRVGQIHLQDGPDLALQLGPLGRVLLDGKPVLPHGDAGLPVGAVVEALVHLDERVPAHPAGQDRQLEQGLPRAQVVRLVCEQLREQPERAGGIPEPDAAQLRELEGEVGVEECRREPLLEPPGEVARPVELGGQERELGGGGRILGISPQARPGKREPLERVDGRGRRGQLETGRHVGVLCEVGEHRHEAVPIAGGLERPGQPREKPGRALPGDELYRAAVGRGGAGGVVHGVGEEVAELGEERRPLDGRRSKRFPLGEQIARLFPALAGQREPGEGREHLRVLGTECASATELRDRLLVGAQLLLGEPCRPQPEQPLLGRLAGEGVGGADEMCVQLGEGLGAGGEVLHPPARLRMGRRLEKGRDGRVESAAGVVEPVLPDCRDVEPHARPVGRQRGFVPGDDLEHVDVPGRVSGCRPDRRERAGDADRFHPSGQELLQRPDGVGGVLEAETATLEEGQPGGSRVLRSLQRLEEQRRPLRLQVGPVGRSLGGQPGEHLAELVGRGDGGVVSERGGEPPQRLRIGAVLGQQVAPGGGAPRRVARLEPEPGDLDCQLASGLPFRLGEAGREVGDEVSVAASPGQRRLVGARGAAVVGVENGELPPDPGRLLGVPQVVLLDLRHPAKQCLAGPEVRTRRRRSGAEGAGQLGEVPGARSGRLHLSPSGQPGWLGDERPGEDAHGLAGISQRIQRDLGCPQQERGPRGRIPLRGGQRLDELDDARPVPGVLEQREERARRGQEARILSKRSLQHPAGADRIPSRERHLGAPQAQRGVLGPAGSGGQVALQRRERLRVPTRVDVGLEEVKGGLVVGGVEVDGAREGLAGSVHVAEADRRKLGEPQVRGHGAGQVARARCEPGQLLPEGRPVAALAVPLLEEVEGARTPRRRQPGAVEGLARHRSAVRVVGHVDRREPQPGPGRVAPVALAAGAVFQDSRLVLPGSRRALQALQRLRRARDRPVEEHGLHRGIEGEPVLERLVGQKRPERCVGLCQLGPVATGLAPAVEELLRVAVPAERLGAGHRPPPRLGQVRREPDGPPVEEHRPVPTQEPLLPPAGEGQESGGGLGRTLRSVRLLLEDRSHPHQVPGLLPDPGERAENVGVAGLECLRSQQQPLGPGRVGELVQRQRGTAPQQCRGPCAVGLLAGFPFEHGQLREQVACSLVDGVARQIGSGRRAHRDHPPSYPWFGNPGNSPDVRGMRLDAWLRGC